MSSIPLPIKAVSQRTGLSPHVIRVWERRYGAVSPSRTGTNRRLYTEEEVERLFLLRRLSEAGHSISAIASLPTPDLQSLAGQLPSAAKSSDKSLPENEQFIGESLAAIRNFDTRALDDVFLKAVRQLGNQGFLRQVVAPLAYEIGELWLDGTVTAAHEHFATAALNLFLNQVIRSYAPTVGAPLLVVATPPGQMHELGALMACAEASNQGWRTTYLGSCLPAAEIAGTAIKLSARAVALSIVYPGDDPSLPAELAALRRFLPPDMPIVVGGRSSFSYTPALKRISAIAVDDLEDLSRQLLKLRRLANSAHRGELPSTEPASTASASVPA